MGRSVSYPSGAWVTFCETPRDGDWCANCDASAEDCTCPEGDRDWSDGETDWDWIKEDRQAEIQRLFNSFWEADDWLGREDHVLARNRLVNFGISEYCGLMAVWLVVRGDLETAGQEALAEQWIKSVWPKFRATFGTRHKVGAMSNGEGVYQRNAA